MVESYTTVNFTMFFLFPLNGLLEAMVSVQDSGIFGGHERE